MKQKKMQSLAEFNNEPKEPRAPQPPATAAALAKVKARKKVTTLTAKEKQVVTEMEVDGYAGPLYP